MTYNSEGKIGLKRYEFDSVIDHNQTKFLRLLTVDNSLVVPFNRSTKFLITSVDVLHSWAIPSMGVKIDACPGRINSVSVRPTRLGVFYGQCSEICGIGHSYMPIVLETVI